MIALIAALSTILAVTFGVLAVRRRPTVTAESRLEELGPGISGRRAAFSAAQGGARHIARDELHGPAKMAAALLPRQVSGRIRRGIVTAGNPITMSGFLLIALTLGLLGTSVGFAIAMSSTGASPVGVAIITAAGALIGLALAPMWLRRRIRSRRQQIWRSLPDAADLLTTCVEAGLGVDAAIARVASELEGPLGTELNAALHEIALGRPRAEALEAVGSRVGVGDLTGMLGAIIESEQTGASLGRVLRAQAQHVRARRKLYAEERARKVPAKMTFPIVFLIVPTLFILILGPLAAEVSFLFD